MPNMQCRHQTVAGLGLLQIVMGAVSLVAGILIVTKKSWVRSYYHGIAAGAWLILAGLVGTCGGCTKSKSLNVTFLLMSLVSVSAVAGGMVVLSFFGYVADNIYSLKELINDMNEEEKIACAKAELGSTEDDKEGYFKCPNDMATLMNTIVLGIGGGLVIVGTLSIIFATCAVCDCCFTDDERRKRVYPRHPRAHVVPVPAIPQQYPMPQQNPYRPLKGHYGFSQQQIAKARQLFARMDVNHDGTLSEKELGQLVRSFGFVANDNELQQLHQEVDRNKDGKIEFEELLIWLASSREENFSPQDIDLINLMRQKYYPLQKEMIFEILRVFKEFDISGDYILSMDELQHASAKMGFFVHPQHLTHLHKTIDQNGDGVIEFEEFLKFTLKTSRM